MLVEYYKLGLSGVFSWQLLMFYSTLNEMQALA